VGHRRRSVERAHRALEPAVPPVLACERGGVVGLRRSQGGQRPEPLALGRRRLDVGGERRKRTAVRLPADIVLGEQVPYRNPEGPRLARRALVADRLAHEHEPPPRPRAHGGEQIAIPAGGVGSHEPGAATLVEGPPRLLVEERLDPRSAWERSLLQTDDEDDLEAAGAGPGEVEYRDAAQCRDGLSSHRDPIERGEHLCTRHRARSREHVELVERARHRVVHAEIEARALAGRRLRRAVRAPKHCRGELSRDCDGRAVTKSNVERRQRASLAELGCDLGGAVSADDSPPAQTALDPVDLLPGEPGVRRSEARE
jgi:hypothetical protein